MEEERGTQTKTCKPTVNPCCKPTADTKPACCEEKRTADTKPACCKDKPQTEGRAGASVEGFLEGTSTGRLLV
jgi:hypothetical protein